MTAYGSPAQGSEESYSFENDDCCAPPFRPKIEPAVSAPVHDCEEPKRRRMNDHFSDLREAGHHLIEQVCHIIPMALGKDGKTPMDKWRHGKKDYTQIAATKQEVDKWSTDRRLCGWGILSSPTSRDVIIDIEPEAFQDDVTKVAAEALRDSVWPECVRRSKNGGFHVYLRISEGDMPADKAICRRDIGLRDGEGDSRTLIAEVRSPLSYAVVCDKDRPLPSDFQPMEVNRSWFYKFILGFQSLHVESKAERKLAKVEKRAVKKLKAAASSGGSGGGTGSVVFDALADGDLPLEAILPVEWAVLGTDSAGRTLFLRDGSESESSGNELDGVIVMHSTSVPWAEPSEGMSPMAVIAGHSFAGDYGAACKSLETAAFDLTEQGGELPTVGPWQKFPSKVMKEVYEARRLTGKEWQEGQHEPVGPDRVVASEVGIGEAESVDEWEDPHRLVVWEDLFRGDDASDPDWIIPNLVVEGRSTALYSKAGVGKSLLTLEGAVQVAVGGEFLGEPVKQRRLLYIDHEQDRGLLRQRLEALGFGTETDLSNLHYSLLGEWPDLDTKAGGNELLAVVDELGVELVIVDTISRTLDGDENSNDTFLDVYKYTAHGLKKRGVAFLRLDHAGKDEGRGQRGGSAKSTDVDLIYRLKESAGTSLLLVREKNRAHMAGPDSISIDRINRNGRLSHEVPAADSELSARVTGCIADLDGLELPDDTGRQRARDAFKSAGLTVRNAVLEEAIRRRKKRPRED